MFLLFIDHLHIKEDVVYIVGDIIVIGKLSIIKSDQIIRIFLFLSMFSKAFFIPEQVPLSFVL